MMQNLLDVIFPGDLVRVRWTECPAWESMSSLVLKTYVVQGTMGLLVSLPGRGKACVMFPGMKLRWVPSYAIEVVS